MEKIFISFFLPKIHSTKHSDILNIVVKLNEIVTNQNCDKRNLTIKAEYLTIIPRGRVGYEMIDSQRGA